MKISSNEFFYLSKLEKENFTGIVLYSNGDKVYFFYGKRHRTDGPAIEYANGDKEWYFNGKRHRTDGSAIEFANGEKHWYYQDQHINVNSQEEFEPWLKVMAFE